MVVINMKLAADRPGFDVCIEPMPALDIAMRIAGAVARLRRAKDDTLLLRRWEDNVSPDPGFSYREIAACCVIVFAAFAAGMVVCGLMLGDTP